MSAGAPTEEEWAKAITRASWPDGGHDGFPTRKVAEMIAAHLRPLIDREREAARAEGAASVAGPVLALADEWQSAAQTRTPESLAHEASARALAARVLWESANALRAAIPADATEPSRGSRRSGRTGATVADRDPLAEVLTESLNIVGPLRHIFGEAGAQIVDALEVLLAQEIEHAADQVRAFLASDEAVDRGAAAICQSVIDGNVLGGTFTQPSDWLPEARAALAAAAEVRS